MNHFHFEKTLNALKNQVDWVGLRFYREKNRRHIVRNENLEDATTVMDQGLMVEVMVGGHIGYAATSDLSAEGVKMAFAKAKKQSLLAARYKAADLNLSQRPGATGAYKTLTQKSLDQLSTEEILSTLLQTSAAMKTSEQVVSRIGNIELIETEIEYLSSNGAQWSQSFNLVSTFFRAAAQDSQDIQARTLLNILQQGAEAIDRASLTERCRQLSIEAKNLLTVENCPTGTMDVLLAPDQMNLQIHESIGHPLELDRVLGDERNYAGWSFVKPEDFGHLQYGSELLNVIFDPEEQHEFASYAFDDTGNKATREYLIKNGKLERGLGSLESQSRLRLPGVANARASSWNRAPIDRMANINIVSGASSLQDMIANTEHGIFMHTNKSWSIDDYRNKFQFGCEYGQMIENGRLTKIVKNPNYRGKTLQFWNSLKAVGHRSTYELHGAANCGKGEPSQLIRVGHGSPVCAFANIEVFGGVS